MREYQKDAIRTVMRYLAGGKYAEPAGTWPRRTSTTTKRLEQRYGSWARGWRGISSCPTSWPVRLDHGDRHRQELRALRHCGDPAGRRAGRPRPRAVSLQHHRGRACWRSSGTWPATPICATCCRRAPRISAPKIINASESIVDGSICVENYHAILEHVKSSIRDSLIGQGCAGGRAERRGPPRRQRVRRKRQEVEGVPAQSGVRLPLSCVGVSGTCYVGDEYFADVVCRYSLRQAIEQRFVKTVEYVAEMPQTDNPDEKWQLIYNRHQDWKKKLKKRRIRPLTIIVTKDIKSCERVAEELQAFLQETERRSPRAG